MIARNLSPVYRLRLNRLDWIVAVALTLGTIVLQFVNARHAGGLWRDEAAAVNLAQLPSWSAIWSNLEHESFPLLITVVIRVWTAVGLGDRDIELRALGFLISLGILTSLWWSAWRLTKAPPLLSLLLVALSPVAIRWGGSLRAYGLGMLLIVFATGAMWHLLNRPSRKQLLLAGILNLLAVHALYQNAVVLMAICVAGVTIALWRGDRNLAVAVFSIAAASAVTLLPYGGVIRRASEWNVVTQTGIDFERIWTVLHRALAASGDLMPWFWAGLLVVVFLAGSASFFHRSGPERGSMSDCSAFLLCTAVLTTIGYYLFLKITKFPTEEWYYLLWMAIIAVAADAIIARGVQSSPLRLLRPIATVAVAIFVFPIALRSVQVRATNVDLAANRLNTLVAAGDLVLVHPWFCVVSFDRYYHEAADLLTLPPLRDHKLQRLDLLKEQLGTEAPLRPVFDRIEATLRNGGTIWLVGHYPFTNPPERAPPLPRPGEGPEGWRAAPYMMAFGMDVAFFLQTHALESRRVEVMSEQPVHPFEDLPVRTISGWHSARFGW